ncbi:MAG: MBOAT family protein [bacterium]|nr:MBOAT family protein [bacterium]
MVFSSQIFLWYFLPLALAVYYVARLGPRWLSHCLLILLSWGFYGWANPPFVLLLMLSTAVDFACGWWVAHSQPRATTGRAELPLCPPGGQRSRAQRAAVGVSVCTNLGILGFFKYANFGIESWNDTVEALGLSHLAWRDFLRVTLPLGISFYTFQSMTYTIDVYRGHARATRNIIDFACYVSLFTQLVAGPILRFSEVATQLVTRRHDFERFARGTALFALGMAKKILVANPAGKVADVCFEAGSLMPLEAWWGAAAYSFQIYFDFSGYSDMAIGLGLMLGFVFPKNFDSPYKSRSLTEFWRRWHISLSSFLRDYLYLPLGGNRRGPTRTYANLMIVMLLGGLWHGAALNFVVWGGIHGLGLGLERALGGRSLYHRLPDPLRMGLTFAIVTVGWIFFRAPDMSSAVEYLGHLVGASEVDSGASLVGGVVYQPYYLFSLGLAAILTWRAPQAWDWTFELTAPKALAALACLWLASLALFTQTYNPFIYFIF